MSLKASIPGLTKTGSRAVLAFLCMVAVIAYIQRAALSVPATRIASDLGFLEPTTEMGWVQSVWYFAYALMQIPSGWLADRMGSRRALALFTVIWSLATLLASSAQGFWSLTFLWGLMGAAQAGAFPCAAKAIGQLFPEAGRARATGLLASGMLVGGAIGPGLTGLILARIPDLESGNLEKWRIVLGAYSLPGFLWTLLFLVLIPNRILPTQAPGPASGSSSGGESSPRLDVGRIINSPSLWLLCAQQFFRAAGMVFFVTWFPAFLQNTRGISVEESGIWTTIAGVGGVVGSLTGGYFSDWLLRRTGSKRLSRQGIAVVGMSICSVLILLSYFVADIRGSIALVSLGAFSASFGGVSGYAVAITFGGSRVALVFSIMNMCGNLGAALFPITAGRLVDWTGNWNLILFLFASIMAIDAVCWALLNPKEPLFPDTPKPEELAKTDAGESRGN